MSTITMASKLYRPLPALLARTVPRFLKSQALFQIRQLSFGFPKQYKQPGSKNFRSPFHLVRYHWELTPLLACVVFDVFLIGIATYNSLANRVDIQLTEHSWNCISRRMNLHEPTVHKLLVRNQDYEPWPEMQDVLDKMADKEAKPCALRNRGK
ncbi:uncharacterized protein LOC134665543 [Cydia fagiglandana]|uniref:uncharacterized protein LOC134665543 n=1 Tax=Cydia fagiglandana TaxID=1458189 RepID=UPI002FEDFF36